MVADGKHGDRAPRIRLWIGLVALAAGCYAVGDTAHRIRAAVDVAEAWWPWALLGLAAVNVVRSAVTAEALIGPLVIGTVALVGLGVSQGIGERTVRDLLVPVSLAVAGAVLVLSAGPEGQTARWSRVLSTGWVVVPADAGPLVTVRAVLGELRADLTRVAGADDRVTVHVTAVGGHVRLVVPKERAVSVHRTGAALTRLTDADSGSETPGGEGPFTIHVLGLCAAVSIVRM